MAASNDRTISEMIPPGWVDRFSEPASRDGAPDEAGLYFSSYVGWHRLLRLPAEGPFLLLLWCEDRYRQIMPERTRAYEGALKLTRFTQTGDRRIDLQMSGPGPKSDLWDASLYVVGSGEKTRLLRKRSVTDLAISIGWNATLGKSERYFSRVSGIDAIPDLRSDGAAAPGLEALPQAIRRLIPDEPLTARIIEVGKAPSKQEPSTTPIVVMVDKGSEDGLRHNMPLISPVGAERRVIGWCSAPEPRRCQVRIRVDRDKDGEPVALPRPGDLLTSRAASAPAI